MKNKLKQFMGAWKGNDLKECLRQVYASRGKFNLGGENMKEQTGISCSHCWDYQKHLKEENEKLKTENNQYAHALAIKENDKYIFNMMKERADYYQAMLSLEDKVKELEAKIEQLTGISGQLKAANQCLWNVIKNGADTVCNNSDLAAENAQLKAQLQNRDKVSQVEHCEHSGAELGKDKDRTNQQLPADFIRYASALTLGGSKPHKCPLCGDQPYHGDCYSCKGTGIVWEEK
jgi:chromosome segregation ATPase